ncbi:MAG: VWA domain-containing protein [Candidatus Methanoperedens sp.]
MNTNKMNLTRKLLIVCVLAFCLITLPGAYADDTAGRPLNIANPISIQSELNSVGGETFVSTATSTYDTYTYTHNDILIFSYTNGTQFEVYNSASSLVWSGTINAGGHRGLTSSDGVSAGTYKIKGTNPYSVLIGDELTSYVLGYYAFDKDGKGLSTKFYTYQVDISYWTSNNYSNFIVFAYEDSTSVVISNSQTGAAIWSGTLNAGQHHAEPTLSNVYITVTATKPVSALSYTDQGYYVPASSGTFIGKKFYTWAGSAGGWTHDLNIIAYSDTTSVTVTNTETGALISSSTLNAGKVLTVPFNSAQYVTVTTDKDVNVGVFPYVSYSSYYYSVHAQDTSGTGIGTLFYYPAIPGGRMVIFSYTDNALVTVTNSAGAVWSGYLDTGESHDLTISTKDIYKIVGTNPIAVVFDWGNGFGADFAPQYYAAPATPTITLNQPNGGETWTVGSTQNITWVASGGTGSLSTSLYYSITGVNGTYTQIATGLPNTGSYAFTVPNAPSTDVFVKAVVTDSALNVASDTSNAAFTIQSASVNQITVTINQIESGSYPTINAYVTVTNQNGTPITGLTASNFAVTENTTCTPSISVSSMSSTGVPVSIAMTVDYSGSMTAANIADAKTGLTNFIGLGAADDRFAIIKFADNVETVQNFTSDKTVLLNKVNSMPNSSSGWTSFYDSIYDAVTLTKAESYRKAVIAFTDGESNDDIHSLTETINYAKANNIPVYTIGLGSVNSVILQQIANETGGKYYYAPSSSQLADIYVQISQQLANQYQITYTTCNSAYDGSYRNVLVGATYSALTGSDTSGYYAPLQQSSITVTLITPTSGPVGTVVSIGGSGFVSGATVQIGSVSATASVLSSTIIQAIVPTLSSGIYNVKVINPDGGFGILSNAFTVTGMSVTGISPNISIINTPTNVVITGSGFNSGATVTVGSASATAVVVVSTTKITATIPATLSAGTYNVVVTNTDSHSATLTNGFTISSSSSSGFFDNIESGTNNWVATGFWHREYKPDQYFVTYPDINPTLVTLPDIGSLPAAYSGNYVWWYGENSTGTFIGSAYNSAFQTPNNGGTSTQSNYGTLTSPAINLASVTTASLSFMTWWEIEGVDVNKFDMMYVDLSNDNGATFTELGSLNPLNDVNGAHYMPYSSGGLAMPGQWYKVSMDISNYTGSSQVKIRFRFNTNDANYNGFRGWLIDDVSIGLLSSNPPSIVVIAPNTGPVSSIFTIGGIGFDKSSVVTVGGITAVSSTSSDTIIQAFVPSLSTGTYDVKVTNPDGQSSTVTDGFTVTTTQPPTVTAISPNSGVFGTSVDVTITGTNINTGASATIGTKALTNVNIVSSTTLTGKIDTTGLTTGSHKVTVTNPDGQFGEKVGAFTVTGAPALVAAIAPSSRVAQVGSSVTMLVSVINYGSEYAQDVELTQHTNLPVSFTFKTWDSLTKFGEPNAKATIKPNNGVAFFVLEITPTSAFPASSMTFDIKTTNGTIVSAPISLVNTFTLSAPNTASADIVMISSITDISASQNVGGVFAIATSNVGNAAATNVSLVVDPGTMPLVVLGRQINPSTAADIGDAQHINIGVGEQPAFAVYYTPTGPIANDPGNNRIMIRLVDSNGNTLGSQSVAIHT